MAAKLWVGQKLWAKNHILWFFPDKFFERKILVWFLYQSLRWVS